MVSVQNSELDKLLSSTVNGLGFEYVGCEYLPHGRQTTLRIYIEALAVGSENRGVTIDDCVLVSRQLGAVLDVEGPIQGEYHLEVSSPGLDRPLFTIEHFKRFVGQQIKVKLNMALNGQRNFVGVLRQVEDTQFVLECEEQTVTLSFSHTDKANLVANFDQVRR